MKITHHPEAESLMSCSAGSMPEAFAAIMATHLTQCPKCRSDLAFLENVGTAMFESLQPVPVSSDAPVMAMRAGEADVGTVCETRNAGASRSEIPASLSALIGGSLDAIEWKRVTPGVWQHIISLHGHSEDLQSRGDLRLMKIAPGQVIPEHGHTGSELTLILRGSYRDATGHFQVGDVADMCGDKGHSPVADPVEGCICLVATDGRMKFTGMLARMVQPFTGF
jgi:putative transcriptional regulator